MKITGTTRIFTIIAHPCVHVVAPAVFNHLFEAMSMDMAYIAHDTPPEALPATIEAYRSWNNLGGFNVTIPHKESAAVLLDELLPPAADLGAVNTVVRSPGGVLTGYNTDGAGAVQAIGDVRGARCLVIGAGGAARAVIHALLQAGARCVAILNRTLERARALLEHFPEDRAGLFHPDMIPEMDVVVQTTPVADHIPLDLDMRGLRKDVRILETVMRDTALGREARSRGCTLIPGHHMLYHQTGENFRLLTGADVPDAVVRQAFAAAGLPLS